MTLWDAHLTVRLTQARLDRHRRDYAALTGPRWARHEHLEQFIASAEAELDVAETALRDVQARRASWTPQQIAMHLRDASAGELADIDLELSTLESDDAYLDDGLDFDGRRRRQELDDRRPVVEQIAVEAEQAFQRVNRLTRKQAADLVCELTGRSVNPDTWSGYVSRGQAPQPDGRDEGRPWWSEWTIRQFAARPVSPGARTDLAALREAQP